MNAIEVYLLGRKLMKIAEGTFPAGPDRSALPASVRMVLVDVSEHPQSSISEITARTGFPQSHVSASVARLREQGVLETWSDPADGRRTLVKLSDEVRALRRRSRPMPIDGALTAELGSSDPAELQTVMEALEILGERLIPKVVSARSGSDRPPQLDRRP